MRHLAGLLSILVGAITLGMTASAGAQTSASDIDRELVVRFTRAYGMAKDALEQHSRGDKPSTEERDAMLRQPDELEADLRQELERILDLNGLERDEWKLMFARMEADEDLRQRVQSLSTPFE